jgi:hypothetical protein
MDVLVPRHGRAVQLEPEARKRLTELKIDDLDTLWQLGDGNKPRVWGMRHGRVFALLWYDPDHTVYKVEKKHT